MPLRFQLSWCRREYVFVLIISILYVGFLSTLIIFETSGASYGISNDLADLKLLHIVSRHGARNPIFFYPNDPYRDHVFLEGKGALTNLGKQQQYELGKFLKERYHDFLTSDPKEVHARSSMSERTMESALTALAGLYPPKGFWEWNRNLTWQPIPVYAYPNEGDYLLGPNATCPAYAREILRYWKTDKVKKFYASYNEFLKFLGEKTGMEIQHLYEVLFIYSTLKIEKQQGLRLADWATKEVLNKMEKIVIDNFRLLYGTTKMQMLRGGPLVKQIISNIQRKSEGALERKKLFWYSTHDAVLAAVMNALDIYNDQAIPFSATIIFEFHSTDSEDFLRIFYANSTTPEKGHQELHQLNIPGCPYDCPLLSFINITSNVTPNDIKKQCFEE